MNSDYKFKSLLQTIYLHILHNFSNFLQFLKVSNFSSELENV